MQVSKTQKDDRILVLKPQEGKKAKATSGLVDPRLFSGENNLHVIKSHNGLWSFKYEHGGLQEPLKQSFTTFDAAFDHAQRYYLTRNIDIVDIIS